MLASGLLSRLSTNPSSTITRYIISMILTRDMANSVTSAQWSGHKPSKVQYGDPTEPGFEAGNYPWSDTTVNPLAEPRNSSGATATAIYKNNINAGTWASILTTAIGGYVCEINMATYREYQSL